MGLEQGRYFLYNFLTEFLALFHFLHVAISSVQSFSCVQLFATPWTATCQASLSNTSSQSLLKLMSIELVMPSNHLILCCPLLLLPSIFPASGSFPVSQFFASGGQSIGVSPSTSVLPMNIQTDFLQDGLAGSPCCPRDSQESSPTPQIKNINSSVLSFLYGPTLTSIHDYQKNHSFDQTELCEQNNVFAFQYVVQVDHSFSSKEQVSFISWLQSLPAAILGPP